MKCAACGYEYRTVDRLVDKVDRFKSGKNKGEIKNIGSEWIELKIGDGPFIQLYSKLPDLYCNRHGYEEYVVMYACPKCHTIRMEIE